MTAQAGGASSPSHPAAAERSALRRQMRARRALLAASVRRRAARAIAARVRCQRLLKPGQRVAVYLSVRGEANLAPVIDWARRLGCHLYLPRVLNVRQGTMTFLRFNALKDLRRSALGLLEPGPLAQRIAPRSLDCVFVPLVAFAAGGHRLGTGGGFYDRRFAYLAGRGWRRPRLIGVGYELQRVASLPTAPWDIPLDVVLTERRVYRS